VLYCADYLEPGRDFEHEHRAQLASEFPRRTKHVLREVARARLLHVIQSDWPLLDPMVRFWNSLAEPSS
jgi:HD superfamily phosphohydrolase YqeK